MGNFKTHAPGATAINSLHPGTGLLEVFRLALFTFLRSLLKPLRGIGLLALCMGVLLDLVHPVQALALQVHTDPEGLYSHQLGHVFFIASMAILIFWLQKTRLAEAKGWRYIQIGCLAFILWNSGAIAGHFIEALQGEEAFVRISSGRALVLEKAVAPYLFYFLKLDHLFAVPAMIFLLLGLRRLKRESQEGRS